jgi:hypothetical protein
MEIAHPQPETAAEIVSENFGIPSPTGIWNRIFGEALDLRKCYSILSAMIEWPLTMTSMEMGGRSPLP